MFYFPKDELVDAENFNFDEMDIAYYKAKGFANGAGVDGEFGYEYQVRDEDGETLHELFFWHYDHEENDGYNWKVGDYSVLVIQQFADQTYL